MTSLNRRNFIKTSVAASVLANLPHVHAAENHTIRFALVGCGGRGRGAAYQGLNTNQGPVKLVAVADAFIDTARGFAEMAKRDAPDRVDLPEERIFGGMDSYKKAIDCLEPGDVIMMAAPPVFRPLHTEYAAKKGVHIFMEKSFGVDGPGVRRILAAVNVAREKGLKMMTGLYSRKSFPTAETVKAIQDGMIGDIVTSYHYRIHGPIPCGPVAGYSPMQHQIRNLNSFNWVCGSILLDWSIHDIDILCWAKQEHPNWVQGCCGRAVRNSQDDVCDHLECEYCFEDQTRMITVVRQIPNTWESFRNVVHGTKGMALLGAVFGNPRIHKTYRDDSEIVWRPTSRGNDGYQEEINYLFQAIREDLPSEDVEFCIHSGLTGIMGRMAMESGQAVSREMALNSDYELCPNIDDLTLESDSPCMPDASGNYEIPKPGITRRF